MYPTPYGHTRTREISAIPEEEVTGITPIQYNPLTTLGGGHNTWHRAVQEPRESSSQAPKNPPETEILHVVIHRTGKQVSAKWGLHPNLKEELKPEEWKELTEIMGKVTTLVGNRFSQVLAQAEEDVSGTA